MNSLNRNSRFDYSLIPIIAALALLPLIVHLKVIPLTGISQEVWTGQIQNFDIFSYYKSVFLILSSITALLILIYNISKKKIVLANYKYYYIAIGIYSAGIIGSTLLSPYKEIAIWGFVDRYEGMFALSSYMILLVVSMNLQLSKKNIDLLLTALFVSATVIGIIGIFQYFGFDIWKSEIGKLILLGSQYDDLSDKLKYIFGQNIVYSTLYHPDYVGSYTALLLPLALCMFILGTKKVRLLIVVPLMALVFIWIGSTSRAGLLGGIGAIILLLIAIRKELMKSWKYFIAILGIILLLALGLNEFSNGYLGKRVTSLYTDVKKVFVNNPEQIDEPAIGPLKDVVILENSAKLITQSEALEIKMEGNNLALYDQNAKPLSIEVNSSENEFVINNPKYKDYRFQITSHSEGNILEINRANISVNLFLTEDQIRIIDNKGNVVEQTEVEKFGFTGKERIGSSRGYIWSRSLPLLKDTLILGHGPDTFPVFFPQQDYRGKLYSYGELWHVVDKPHNLYLQVALNTGVISLLGLMVLYVMYAWSSIKKYFCGGISKDITQIAGLGIFVGTVGYLIAGFFNDSVLSVTPVFWILLGIGIKLNLSPVKNLRYSNEVCTKARLLHLKNS